MSLESYTEAEEKGVWATICTLRQMRCAGENVQNNLERTLQLQEILNDAEALAQKHAFYLVHLLVGDQTPEMLGEWEEIKDALDEKYANFPMIRRSPFGMPLLNVKTKLRMMSLNDPEYLTEYFITGEHIAKIKFNDLFDDELGILAPLSTDILVASMLPEFIQLHHSSKIPHVKPALVSTDLKTVSLPKNESGVPVFSELRRVLAYVDLNAMGDTRRTLFKAAQLEYPGRVIPTGR